MAAASSTVYAWGLNADGQCVPGSKDKIVRTPAAVRPPRGLRCPVQVSCGNHWTLVLDETGVPWSIGSSRNGRLGHAPGTSHADVAQARTISLPIPALSVSAGASHGAAVLEDGSVWSWGKDGVFAADAASEATPRQIAPSDSAVKRRGRGVLASGERFTAFIARDGSLSILAKRFGASSAAALAVPLPEAVLPVVSVDAGSASVICADSAGSVFLVSLGDGSPSAKRVWNGSERSTEERAVTVAVTAGAHHVHYAFSSATGAMFTWGSGYKGKLGHGEAAGDADAARPGMVAVDGDGPSMHVKQALAGGIHSGFVSSDGALCLWGCGSDGRLGFPESEGTRYLFRENAPRKVVFPVPNKRKAESSGGAKPDAGGDGRAHAPSEGIEIVSSASLGYYHSAAIVERGGE